MLRRVRIEQFRSYPQVALDIHHPLVLLSGPNGVGKTSVLEAVHLLGTLSSFRTTRNADYFPKHDVNLPLKIQADFVGQSFEQLKLTYEGLSRRCFVDHVRSPSLSAFMGHLSPIAITPESHAWITQGPEYRRRFLDRMVFTLKPHMWDVFSAYKKALKLKQELLSQDLSMAEYQDLSHPFNHQLLTYGQQIRDERQILISELTPRLGRLYFDLSSTQDDCYIGNLNQEALRVEYSTHQHREYFAKRCLFGPHRDNPEIFLRGVPARQTASQGERATIIVALSLAYIEKLHETLPKTPKILLLDDPGATLDPRRRDRLFQALSNLSLQTLIASPDEDIEARVIDLRGASYRRVDQADLGISFARWEPK